MLPNGFSVACGYLFCKMKNLIQTILTALFLAVFGALSAQTITVLSPNGGETLTGCTSSTISWSTSGIGSPYFDIDYSPDNGSSWVAIASNYFSPGGTYSWTLPNISSGSFLVRVSLSSNSAIKDQSNAVFSVTGALIVNSPNGGQSWTSYSSQTISWTPSGTSGTYRIEYSTDNGTSWILIANNYSTGGNTYLWNPVPNTPSSQCLVRVSDVADLACKTDASDATFFILSSVTVLSPNGGENYQAKVGFQGNAINMDNVPVTLNTGNFYDFGGPAGNTNGVSYTKTFTPDNPLNKLKVSFTDFSLGTGTLRIYNGPTASNLVGTYTGTTLPTSFTSTHFTGALTFVVTGGSGSGWKSYLESVGTATQNVSWNTIGTSGRFDLDYSTNNGSSWTRILTDYPSSTGVFPWQVPNTPSTNCLFRVKDFTNGAIVDQSDANFSIGAVTPVIVLDAPNGGQAFYAGTSTNITWRTGFVASPTIKLEYSTDNGATWLIITAATANTGTYSWTVPPTPSTQCLVRASDPTAPTINDVSNSTFTIYPYIRITSPNGGQSLSGCNTQNITFQHGGTSGTFQIDYSTDNGTTWNLITSNYTTAANPANYTGWQLPNIVSTQSLVRVSDASDALKTDVSDAIFTINQTTNVQIVSPNGGQNFVTGTVQPVTYTVGGGVTNVRLEYSTNNGANWFTMNSNSSGGLYSWTVPNRPSDSCLVRATDISNSCNSDVGNGLFTITSELTVTAPNTPVNWQATVGVQGTSYNMDNAPITLNTGNFYDAGGPTGSTTSTTYTKTFTPDNPLNKLKVSFNSFSVGTGTLRIYNGPTASSLIGTYTGTGTPPNFTSTHYTGALTFVVTGASGSGWEAQLESVGTPTQNVTWNTIGTSGVYDLDYSTNNGTSWIRILTGYPSVAGTFNWQVPNTPSSTCLFRVSDNDNNTIVDESDTTFTIGPVTPVIVLDAPNTAIQLYPTNSYTIAWRTGFVNSPTVKLEYSTNGGTTWLLITSGAINTGTYSWTVPNTPSTTCRVRVSDPTAAVINDVSDQNFTIHPHLRVITPNGGQVLSGCNTQNITFQHGGTSGTFQIDYSTDNGTTWNLITSNYTTAANPANYTGWQLPNQTSTNMLVRVLDAADSLKIDQSDATFTVNQSSHVIMVTPNGGQNWIAGTSQSIVYSLSGGVTTVRLEYSVNNGANWSTITNSSTGGSYSWTVPNLPSTTCLIRATDVSNSCKTDESDAVFTITSNLQVMTPNGGQVWPAVVGPQGSSHNMDNAPVTINTGNFYDSGGPNGSTNGTSYTKTFTPDNPLNKLRVSFNDFNIGTGTLRIYNSTTTTGLVGTYTGTSIPSTYTATNSAGALTFVITGGSGSGWKSQIESIGTATQNVTWNITGTSGEFDLEYSTNAGTSWVRILSDYPSSTGVFPWQVPNTLSSNCLFKIWDSGNNVIVDQSDAVFTIGDPTPQLISPNGGETWYSGQVRNITWVDVAFLNPTVRLEYSTNNGNSWILINNSVPNNGSYAWTIPATNTPFPNCRVRVSDGTNSYINDVSNAVFEIRPPIMVVSPNTNSGSTFRACTSSSITWTAGISSNYKIELTTDNGASWSIISSNYAAAGSSVTYNWSIPNTPSTQCRVRVSDVSQPLYTDMSDSTFTISPSIVVNYPNFGGTMQSGTVETITWTNYNASNFYNIDYSTNGGASWVNIVTNYNTATSSYNWTVPALSSSNCLVRVTDFSANCKSDYSDQPFSINASVPPVTITAPNGGESWPGCSVQNITWNTVGTSTTFNIEYSSNGGLTWSYIASNYNTLTNTFAWTVPNTATSQGLIRVTDALASSKLDVSNGVFNVTQPVTASITTSGPTTFCTGNSVTLTSNSTTGNLWSSGQTTQSIVVTSSGSYSVQVTSAGCSSTSAPVVVTVNPQPLVPTITASGPTTFCFGGSVVLSSNNNVGNTWIPGGQTSQSIVASTSGNYAVMFTDANGCSSTSNTVTVTENPIPSSPTASSNSPVNAGSAIMLAATTVPGATYTWTGPNGFSSTSQNPTIPSATVGMAGNYAVVATVNGCSSTASTTLVNVIPGSPTSDLSGTVRHPNNTSTIRSVTLDVTGPTTASMVTGTNGQYNFTGLTSGGNYVLAASKANDTTTNNGITTLDLVLMQRHILNQDTLDSPYKILAADVNNSNNVTTLDIVLTRTVILQTNLTFPGGKLWSMVDASYVFPNSYSPWPFPSTITYPSLATQTNQDFYGVKLGDVNWSWNPAVAKASTVGERYLSFGDFSAKIGDEVTVPVMAESFDGIAGYQFTLNWDPSVLELIGHEGMATEAWFGEGKIDQGSLLVSWNHETGGLINLPNGSTLFNLRFKVIGEAGTSTMISANGSRMAAEAYNENLDVLEVKSHDGSFKVVGDQGAQAGGSDIQWYPSFPNPFTRETTIRFELPETRQMRFTIADMSGKIHRQFGGVFEGGMHEVTWDGKTDANQGLPAGTYMMRIEAGSETHSYRLIYIKE